MSSTYRFFKTLFPNFSSGFVEIRVFRSSGPARQFFFPTISRLVRVLPRIVRENESANICFSVAPRAQRKGTKDAIKRIPVVWVDLDLKDFPTRKDAIDRIRNFPMRPTVIVDSGHGWHLYWRLSRQIRIRDASDVSLMESRLKGLARALGGDQNSTDLSRVLRVPGSWNRKNPSSPLRTRIVLLKPEREYRLRDLAAHITAHKALQETLPTHSEAISDLLTNLKPGNRNSSFFRIAARLHSDGRSYEDIFALLSRHAERCEFSPQELGVVVRSACRQSPAQGLLPPPRLKLLPDILASGPPEISWVVKGILPKRSVGIIAGTQGSGKTWLLLDLAIEAYCGGLWLNHFPVSRCRVLYWDEESSEELLRFRLAQLLAGKRLRAEDVQIPFGIGLGLSLSDPQCTQQLRELLSLHRPQLVIVDSLIRVHRAEENSATGMAEVFGVVKDFVREFGCAFIFADHQRKNPGFGGGHADQLRGSSEKGAFADTLLSVQKLESHKVENHFTVEHSKSRFGKQVPEFVFKIEDKAEGTTVTWKGEAEPLKKEARQREARGFLELVLHRKDSVSRQDLVKQAKKANIGEKLLDETLKSLLEEGTLQRKRRKTSAGRGTKGAYYRWKEGATSPHKRSSKRRLKVLRGKRS